MDQQRLSVALVEKLGCNKFYDVCKDNTSKRINDKKLQSSYFGKYYLN